jgi:hypothetical protein
MSLMRSLRTKRPNRGLAVRSWQPTLGVETHLMRDGLALLDVRRALDEVVTPDNSA